MPIQFNSGSLRFSRDGKMPLWAQAKANGSWIDLFMCVHHKSVASKEVCTCRTFDGQVVSKSRGGVIDQTVINFDEIERELPTTMKIRIKDRVQYNKEWLRAVAWAIRRGENPPKKPTTYQELTPYKITRSADSAVGRVKVWTMNWACFCS
jgi:hypothetical protein